MSIIIHCVTLRVDYIESRLRSTNQHLPKKVHKIWDFFKKVWNQNKQASYNKHQNVTELVYDLPQFNWN